MKCVGSIRVPCAVGDDAAEEPPAASADVGKTIERSPGIHTDRSEFHVPGPACVAENHRVGAGPTAPRRRVRTACKPWLCHRRFLPFFLFALTQRIYLPLLTVNSNITQL